MTTNVETIIDECGIEMIVGYTYDESQKQQEYCHGPQYVETGVYTELDSVEIVIKGSGIDILPRLNEKQKEFIIEQLNYE